MKSAVRKSTHTQKSFQILLVTHLSKYKTSEAQKFVLSLTWFRLCKERDSGMNFIDLVFQVGCVRSLSFVFRTNTCSLLPSINRADRDAGVCWMPSTVWQADAGHTWQTHVTDTVTLLQKQHIVESYYGWAFWLEPIRNLLKQPHCNMLNTTQKTITTT